MLAPLYRGFVRLLEARILNAVRGLLESVQSAFKKLFWQAFLVEQKIEHGHSQNPLVVVSRLHHIAHEHDFAETVGYFAKWGLFLACFLLIRQVKRRLYVLAPGT